MEKMNKDEIMNICLGYDEIKNLAISSAKEKGWSDYTYIGCEVFKHGLEICFLDSVNDKIYAILDWEELSNIYDKMEIK